MPHFKYGQNISPDTVHLMILTSHINLYPIVNICCSGPTMNTHSKKWNITIPNPINQQYFITLPSTLDSNDVVQLIQPDMISYDLRDLEEEDFAGWRRMKEEELRAR